MPYSPTTWADSPSTSSPISAANLNKIETELARLKVNADLDPAAAIAYSKLALALSIVNGDISASAAIAYSKLSLASSIVNADISASAAIASSKLADPVARGLYRKTTAKTVTNTITETDLLNGEITIGANVLGASGLARLTMWGDWIQNSTAARDFPRWKFKIGSGPALVLDTNVSGGAPVQNGAGRFGWRFVVEILNLGATNSQWITMNGEFGYTSGATGNAVAFATGEGSYQSLILSTGSASSTMARAIGSNSAAFDTTGAMALQFTVTNPTATATCETKLVGALVEVV